MQIKKITTRKIINSASSWTIETTIELLSGITGTSSIPGGLSKGSSEVDNIDPDQAIIKIKELSQELTERDFKSLEEFDRFLIEKDGTDKKSNLGGNTMLSLSIAYCKACAKHHNLETYEYLHTIISPEIPLGDISFKMPKLMVLIFEGGLHGSGLASIQEFMAITNTIERALEIYNSAKAKLKKMDYSVDVGAEGAFSPHDLNNEEILEELTELLSENEQIALDAAANSFKELGETPPDYEKLISDFPIYSIEDPYTENDWSAWENFYRSYKSDIVIVADDLTTTNPDRLEEAIRRETANAIIIKPNQIGTITEVIEVVNRARLENWQTIVSHRGTDTNDDFVADLAVAIQSEFVKFGAPARGERVAKYNRLLEIFKNHSK